MHGYISPDDWHYFSLKPFNSGYIHTQTQTHTHTHTHTHTQKKEKRLTVCFIKLVLSTKNKNKNKNSLLIMYHFLRLNRSGGKISWLNWKGQFAGSRCHTQSYTLMLCSDQVTPGVKDGISRFPAVFASPVPDLWPLHEEDFNFCIPCTTVSYLGLLSDGDSNFCIPSIAFGASQRWGF